jgi:hypothetical protein
MAYRKDLERSALMMGKIKNPVNPQPGNLQNLSNSKTISPKKFERKLNKANDGEVFEAGGAYPEKVKQTYVKKGNKTFIKRESPYSDYNATSYMKVKNK